MASEDAGSAWYELGAKSEPLRDALRKAEADIKRAGETGERAFATPMERATGRAAKGIRDVGTATNSLSDKSPRQLADALNKAETEAEQALAAIKKLAAGDDLSPREAQKYADALDEMGIEAQQTQAELRELQRADPRFDTAELQRASTLLDKVGDEASETAGQLNRMAKGDTGLERVSRDAREAAGDLGKAEQRAGKFRGAMVGLKGAIVGLGVAFGLREALGKMNEAVEAASALEGQVSQTAVVFGEAAGKVDEFATSSSGIGLSERAARQAAGTFGTLTINATGSADAAADMSIRMAKLGVDLASFTGAGVTTQEALDAIRAGLIGETEPLRRFNILLSDAEVRTKAVALGLADTTAEVSDGAKVQARYALILEKSALQQGDMARTSEEYANQQRILNAETEDMMAQIGQDLLPLWKDFIGFLRDPGIPIIKDVIGGFQKVTDAATVGADHVGDMLNRMAIQWGHLGKGIEERAQAAGLDVVEFKNLVITAMNEMNMSLTDAERYAEQTLSGIPLAMTDAGQRSLAAWKQTDMANVVIGDVAAIPPGVDGAMAGTSEALSGPLEEGADDAVEAVESMYARIAGVIAEREQQLAAAGGNAVEAWFDPQVWNEQLTAVNFEIENADDLLAEKLEANRQEQQTAREEGDAVALAAAERASQEIVMEHQARNLALAQEAITLKMNLATTGTEMEQIVQLSSLRQSQFMIDGLNSKDPEIRALFQEWKNQLIIAGDAMQAEAAASSAATTRNMLGGLLAGEPAVHGAIRGLGDARPDTSWAYGSGASIAGGVALGISQNAWQAQSALAGMAQNMRMIMPSSEPQDPSSPFRGITQAWGFMDTLASAIERTSPKVNDAFARSMDQGQLFGPSSLPSMQSLTSQVTGAPPSSTGSDSARNGGGAVTERHVHIHAEQGYDMLRNENDLERAVQRAQWLDEWTAT